MLQPPSNFLNTERSTHMFLRQTVPNDFPKPKSNKIKIKAFDLGLLPVCSRGEGWLFLLSLSLKRSKWMFTPSPLTDTEVRSCPCGGAALQKNIQSGESIGEFILQHVSEKGKSICFSIYVGNTFRYTLFWRRWEGRATKTKNHTSEIGWCPKPQ